MGRRERFLAMLVACAMSVFGAMWNVWSGSVASAAPKAPACAEVLVAGSAWLGGGGVDVKSNGRYQTSGQSCGGTTQYGGAWQCVELANRLYATKGWYTESFALGADGGAKLLYPLAAEGRRPGLVAKKNGTGYIPVPGDLIIHSEGTYGHVAIVDRVVGNKVLAVEQNKSTTGWALDYNLDGNGRLSQKNATIPGVVHATRNFANGQLLKVADGSAYHVQPVAGVLRRRRVPTAATERCVLAGGATEIPGVRVEDLGGLVEGDPLTPCIVTAEVVNRIARVAATGTAYFVDGNAVRHWIPDGETYLCLAARGIQVVEYDQRDVDSLAPGANQVPCLDPARFYEKILQAPDGYSYLVDGAGKRHWIPNGGTFLCLKAWRNRPVVGGLTWDHVRSLEEIAPAASCSVPEAANRIIRVAATGTAYYVDGSQVRHWVPDGETYLCLTGRGIAVIDSLTQDHADALAEGGWQPRCLDPARFYEKILQAPDGYSYLVDGAGKRHWIPNGGTFLCLKAWRNRPVVGGLTWDHVRSLEEIAPAASCSVPEAANRIIRVAATGTAYYVDGSQVRHWVPDGETYLCLIGRGIPVIDSLTQDHADALAEGGWQPRCLDPGRAAGKIVRESGGTSYYVDGSGVRHWIQDGYTFECLQARGVAVLSWNLTWEHLNSLREGARQPYCLAAWRVRNKVVRASDGTSYYVDTSDLWHWIPDGGTYNCLVTRYGLAGTFTWEHLNSLRREGAWASC